MTTTLTLPSLDLRTVDTDLIHLVCCDDTLALCGVRTLAEWTDLGPDDPHCPLCALLWDEGLPCSVAGCPMALGREVAS